MVRQRYICSSLNFLLAITFGFFGELQDCRVFAQLSRWVGLDFTIVRIHLRKNYSEAWGEANDGVSHGRSNGPLWGSFWHNGSVGW